MRLEIATSIPTLRVIRDSRRVSKTYRDEVLDGSVFDSVEQVREITEDNEERPHDSLGRVPPLTLQPRVEQSRRTC